MSERTRRSGESKGLFVAERVVASLISLTAAGGLAQKALSANYSPTIELIAQDPLSQHINRELADILTRLRYTSNHDTNHHMYKKPVPGMEGYSQYVYNVKRGDDLYDQLICETKDDHKIPLKCLVISGVVEPGSGLLNARGKTQPNQGRLWLETNYHDRNSFVMQQDRPNQPSIMIKKEKGHIDFYQGHDKTPGDRDLAAQAFNAFLDNARFTLSNELPPA